MQPLLLCSFLVAVAPDAGSSTVSLARERLSKALEKELSRDDAALVDGKTGELIVLLKLQAFEKLDPIWKILHAVKEESKRADAPPLRVELMPHAEERVCLQHEELVKNYLFKKQRADSSRISVWGNCAETPAR